MTRPLELPATYSLTHIDGHRLPFNLPVNGAEYVITAGALRLDPPNEVAALPSIDGRVRWELRGMRLPAAAAAVEDRVIAARHGFRRTGPAAIAFPLDDADVPPEYTAEHSGDELTLRVVTTRDHPYSPTRLFGGDRVWRFRSAPGDTALADTPRQTQRVFQVTTFGGREIPWLSRLVNALFGHQR